MNKNKRCRCEQPKRSSANPNKCFICKREIGALIYTVYTTKISQEPEELMKYTTIDFGKIFNE